MSFRLLLRDIEELANLLVLSHQSSGKTVAISRNNNIWVNLSAKSTINEWSPEHRIVQTSFLDVVGSGDGGKLGAFITISLIRSLAKHENGGHPDLTRQLISELEDVISELKKYSKESVLSDMISLAKDIDFSEQLASAVMLGGVDTHISLEKYEGTEVEIVESESFISEAKPHIQSEDVILKGSMFAFHTQRLTDFEQVRPILEEMGAFKNRPLILLAPMLRGSALATLKKNREEGEIEAYGVEVPLITWGKGWLEDVASFTGGKLFDPHVESFTPQHFGSAKEVVLKSNEIIIDPYDDHAEITAERIDQLLYEASNSPHAHTQDLWRKRASSLSGSLVRVKIGGVTEGEARLRRSLAEKHLISMVSMVKSGHVEGAIPTLSNIKGHHPIIDRALVAPLKVVAMNKKTTALDRVLSENPVLFEPFPLERLISILRSSFSVATTLCSIGHIIRKK